MIFNVNSSEVKWILNDTMNQVNTIADRGEYNLMYWQRNKQSLNISAESLNQFTLKQQLAGPSPVQFSPVPLRGRH